MNELQVFENSEFGSIRTATIENEPWFVGKDVALALGYSNTNKALADHVDSEDKRQGDGVTIRDPIGREQHPTIINESGLYSLILSSKLPTAKKFKHWVTSEVLPAIRKTGRYEMHPVATRALTSDDYMEAARTVSKCHNSRLPIVLDLYRKAGLDIPKVQELTAEVKTNTDEVWEKVRELLNQYSLREAANLLGIPWTSLCYYRNGTRRPPEERCTIIIERLGGE